MSKKIIIISAINFFEGGPLSVLKDCLNYINESTLLKDFTFMALVHKKELLEEENYKNITFVEFPKSRKSYLNRLYYEYVYFKKFAKRENVYFWLSLHDITPSLTKVKQAVYCHNPSPFYRSGINDFRLQKTFFFQSLLYHFLYKKNIKNNDYVIVQQEWLKKEFIKRFDLDKSKVIVSTPNINLPDALKKQTSAELIGRDKVVFSYATFPRVFKNIEIICEGVKILNKKNINNFEVNITIDGTENKYSKYIIDKYGGVDNINFLGLISRDKVYDMYSNTNVLLFPSKLETWGLPITEFKEFERPIFAADLPYAKETVGDYKYVKYFNPNKPEDLSDLMMKALNNRLIFSDSNQKKELKSLKTKSWNELFNVLLEKV